MAAGGAGSFGAGVRGWTRDVETRDRNVFVGVTTEVQRSVVLGSELTGAPGQPVDTGALRDSYIPEFLDENTWQTTTSLPYAEGIENLVGPHGPIHIRSSVGGGHSVKLTAAGFDRIVASEAAKARGR